MSTTFIISYFVGLESYSLAVQATKVSLLTSKFFVVELACPLLLEINIFFLTNLLIDVYVITR